VADALVQYMPDNMELVTYPSESEFEIIHVTGRHDAVQKRVDALERKHKPYAIIQYVLKSSKNPSVKDWLEIWQGANVVWSYYDLSRIGYEEMGDNFPYFRFYYSPLGVDANIFKEHPGNKPFAIGVNSQDWLTESARECGMACQQLSRSMFFLGSELHRPNIVCRHHISDQEVARYWSQCQYVSGLRRTEGFEFPVIEGLLCGARPIVFDQPHYKWYDDFAIFIPELPRDETIAVIKQTLEEVPQKVTEEEKQLVRERFNWEFIIKNFWKEALWI